MCGGDVEVVAGQAYGTCQYCGTQQTLPTVSDEQIANLYNRANNFRRLNEFDKAVEAYDKILNLNNKDAEAHWGIVLSKYGIEYVEDEESHERIPTCHRVQNDSILTDADYLAALENAEDNHSKSLYEIEAKQIAEIQKGILAISNKEKPYDVFICYKEMSESGQRTKDSALAQDVYYELTQEGYKVFFSRITLEDKLGQQYEPYIFAALNSARVMLVIGTKQEYFNSVWVKNEWSRFLKLAKNDSRKLLIPCYQDMDAYDLPEEMSMLQSQDMSKIGFIQDLIRGVKKVIDSGKQTKASSDTSATVQTDVPGVESLYRRACLFLEDGDFKQADKYFDRILDIQPEHAKAYVGKLCAIMKAHKESELINCPSPLQINNNYQKAVRFADEKYRDMLVSYNQTIIDRNENDRKQAIYDEAMSEKLNTETKYKSRTEAEFQKSRLLNETKNNYKRIAEMFSTIPDFRDAKAQQIDCEKYAVDCESKEKQAIQREEEEARIERERKEEEERIIKITKMRKLRRNIIISAIVFVVIGAVVVNDMIIPSIKYSNAEDLLFRGKKYEEAIQAFIELDDYNREKTWFIHTYRSVESLSDRAINFYAERLSVGIIAEVRAKIRTKEIKEQVEKLGVSLDTFGGLKWRVLAVENEKALIITDEIVELRPYNEDTSMLIIWEECDLREYLNGEFYNKYFSDAEKELIIETVLINGDSHIFKNKGGNNTMDKVFVLSIDEVDKYFKNTSERLAKFNNYYVVNDRGGFLGREWWLRTPGDRPYEFYVAYIDKDGYIDESGTGCSKSLGIRPALWLKLQK